MCTHPGPELLTLVIPVRLQCRRCLAFLPLGPSPGTDSLEMGLAGEIQRVMASDYPLELKLYSIACMVDAFADVEVAPSPNHSTDSHPGDGALSAVGAGGA